MSTTTHPNANDASLDGARAWFSERRLTRPRDGRLLAGVSAGFARRYEINPLVARLIAFTTVLVLTPLGYVAGWVLMPSDPAPVPAGLGVA
jgi:phage shock protein PspC (stress-responsive transcriptional regulator)